MLRLYKLFRGNVAVVHNFCRYGSIKQAGGKWAEMLQAHEENYFTKKDQEYLDYIKQELHKGRKISDIIKEHHNEIKRQEELKQAAEKQIKRALDKAGEQERAILTKSAKWMKYLEEELKKGRSFDEIIEETKKAIKSIARKK